MDDVLQKIFQHTKFFKIFIYKEEKNNNNSIVNY